MAEARMFAAESLTVSPSETQASHVFEGARATHALL